MTKVFSFENILSKSLRPAIVNNLEGVEAKVIILSLIRSNNSGIVGYLCAENHVNEFLSLAQYGMKLVRGSAT